MPTGLRTATCPLCKDEFDDAMLYSAHLAGAHGLIDDEGTETVIPEVEVEEPEPAAVAASVATAVALEPGAEAEAQRVVVVSTPERVVAAPTPSRVAMAVPAWLVLVVVVQLLVGIAGAATVGGDSKDADTASVQAAAGSGAEPAAEADADADASDAGEAKTSGGGGASNASPAPTAAPSTVNPLLDQQLADQVVVRAGDLPPGWTAVDPAEINETGEEILEGEEDSLASSCDGADLESEDPSAEAASTFEHLPSMVIGGSAVFSSEKAAGDALHALMASLPCMAEGFIIGAESEPGVDATAAPFQSLGFAPVGSESWAQGMDSTMIIEGTRFPLRLDVLAIRKDRAVTFVMIISMMDTGLDRAQERALMAKLAGRMTGEAA